MFKLYILQWVVLVFKLYILQWVVLVFKLYILQWIVLVFKLYILQWVVLVFKLYILQWIFYEQRTDTKYIKNKILLRINVIKMEYYYLRYKHNACFFRHEYILGIWKSNIPAHMFKTSAQSNTSASPAKRPFVVNLMFVKFDQNSQNFGQICPNCGKIHTYTSTCLLIW